MVKTQLTGNQRDLLKIGVAAAGRGDLDAVQPFLDNRPEWIHTIDLRGRTMLLRENVIPNFISDKRKWEIIHPILK